MELIGHYFRLLLILLAAGLTTSLLLWVTIVIQLVL